MRLFAQHAIMGTGIVVLTILSFLHTRSKKSTTATHEEKHATPSLRRTSRLSLSKLSQMTAQEDHLAKKLKLILHFGSPTIPATMLSHYSLTHAADLLAWTYEGIQYEPYYQEREVSASNRTLPTLLREVCAMFTNCNRIPKRLCCDKLRELLKYFKSKQQNVFLSDDSLSQIWQTPEQYYALKLALQADWDVSTVDSYQQFNEWIHNLYPPRTGIAATEDRELLLPSDLYLDENPFAVSIFGHTNPQCLTTTFMTMSDDFVQFRQAIGCLCSSIRDAIKVSLLILTSGQERLHVYPMA